MIVKNLFEKETVDELLSRIDNLRNTSQRQWGKMDVAQMLAHCGATMNMASGRLNRPRALIGRLLGPFVKSIFINEKPFSRNSPTDESLRIADQREFVRERDQLKAKLREFHQGGDASCTRHPHPFFGPCSPQEWARGMYKHLDHHLRQFGA